MFIEVDSTLFILLNFYAAVTNCYITYNEPLILTLLHSEGPKLHRVLAILSAIGLRWVYMVTCCMTCHATRHASIFFETMLHLGHRTCCMHNSFVMQPVLWCLYIDMCSTLKVYVAGH